MGKKIKPIANESLDQKVENEENSATSNESKNESNVSFQKSNFTAISVEQQQKNEYIAQIEEINKKLIEENSQLQEQLADYIIKCQQANSTSSSNISNESNEQSLDSLYEEKYNELKAKYEQLQNDSDQQLIKISDLTFQIAKLRSQLEEKHQSTNTTIESKKPDSNSKLEKPTYNPYVRNGYSSWN